MKPWLYVALEVTLTSLKWKNNSSRLHTLSSGKVMIFLDESFAFLLSLTVSGSSCENLL